MLKKPARHAVICAALLVILAGCQTSTTVTSESCLIFAPITYSASQDSAETVRQIRDHNAVWDSLDCD